MRTIDVECPSCGEKHEIYMRDPLVSVVLIRESICTTQPGDEHLSYAPGRAYGLLQIRLWPRVAYWLAGLLYGKPRAMKHSELPRYR